jgi:hypothetical protein
MNRGMDKHTRRTTILMAAIMAVTGACASAETPRLKLTMKSGTECEGRKKEQIERLAARYDLSRYTLTRDIAIEQGAVAHSSPVLTLNCRFLEDDDLALSQYIHEQGHWVLMERHRTQMAALFDGLKRMFPRMPVEAPQGSGDERSTYFHVVVIMLEWPSVEDLAGAERARKVLEFKQTDHYMAIYKTVLGNREAVEKLMRRYGIKF